MDQHAIRVDHIGHEGQPVVVVDNFSPHPDLIARDAGSLEFRPMGQFYPGVRAPVTPRYFEGIDRVISTVMRQVFGATNRVTFDRALYSLTTTPPEDLNLAQRIPHIDGVSDGMIAIIHYLSTADFGGTAFYRHRTTGFETVGAERHRIYLDALKADITANGEPPAGYIAGDTPIFDQIANYAPAFNRALIYRGNLLHCAALNPKGHLSDRPDKGRLTIASFLTIA